ncbi:MAG: DUF4838 domain-containing protein [Clostridia bacterium]|nr:DUF4838 domain-containing protein [Clostridia bacterium]
MKKLKKLKKATSIFLSMILSASFLVGCAEKESVETIQGPREVNRRTFTDGIHQFESKERADYLVSQGKSDYIIVMPKTSDKYTQMALTELTTLFEQATGINLPYIVETEEGLTHSSTAKYISLGNTKMFESSGITLDIETLKTQGVRIVTLDNTVYINGGTNGGVLWGVYDFLQILFDFEMFYEDCWYIDENVKNLKMRSFDVVDVPDIETRLHFSGYVHEDINNISYRFRMPYEGNSNLIPLGDTENGARARGIHNTDVIFYKKAPDYDSNWSSDNGAQLCYTAHGNQESYDKMVEKGAKMVQQGLKTYTPEQYPNFKYATITMTDDFQRCTCDACGVAKEKYGADSGAIIVFLNKVMEKVSAWMELPENAAYKREDFRLFFFAYQCYIEAPVRYDETEKKWVIKHPDCEMRDDVGVYLATMPGVHYASNIYEDEVNDVGRLNMEQWFDISKEIYLWTYNINFSASQFFSAHTVFDNDYYQFMASGPVAIMETQNRWDSYASCFNHLKPYLDSKLMWDSSLDVDALIERYFEVMYGEAAPVMKDIMMQMQSHNLQILEDLDIMDQIWKSYFYTVDNKDFWPIYLIKSYEEKFDLARSIIKEKYEVVDPERCELLISHIDIEYVGIAYYFLSLYQDNPGDVDLYNKVKTYFKTELVKLPLDKFNAPGKGISLAEFEKSL